MFLIYQMTYFPMSRIRIYNFILCSKTNTTFRNVFSELRIKYSIKSCYSKIQARCNSASGWSNIHRHVISWKSIQRCFSIILSVLFAWSYLFDLKNDYTNVWKECHEDLFWKVNILDWCVNCGRRMIWKIEWLYDFLKSRYILSSYNFIYFYSEELYFKKFSFIFISYIIFVQQDIKIINYAVRRSTSTSNENTT